MVESFVSQEEFLPTKYSLIQRESKKDIDDYQFYDREKHLSYFRYKKLKNGEKTTKKVDVPIPHYFQDSFSSLFFLRSLPLQDGLSGSFPIVTREKLWNLEFKVLGQEVIRVMGKSKKSWKIEAITRYSGNLVRKGKILFWLSITPSHVLYRFEAKVKIGHVRGELIEYSN